MRLRGQIHPLLAWFVLSLPLIAAKLWVLLGIGFYSGQGFAGDSVACVALCAALVLLVRRRALRPWAWILAWILAWLVYGAAALVELAEALSYYFQASSFDARFFDNARLGNLATGLHAFPVLVGGSIVGLTMAWVLAGWLLAGQSRNYATDSHPLVWTGVVVVLGIIALAVPSAGHRLVDALRSRDASLLAGVAGQHASSNLDNNIVPRDAVRAKPGKNLVIVYMESLERIYTDPRIFPGLTPNLDRWRARGLDFSGYLTFAGADYTMAGIFASQCGAPFFASPGKSYYLAGDNPNATTFQPALACLGDVLHAAGYAQTFMKGAPLAFANQGQFFKLHGFDHVLGLDELQAADDGTLQAPGWGLYDSDLFRLAADRFTRLAAAGKPFNLEVLTVDDHPPHGRPSPGCPRYAASDNRMLQAVHCTDYLVDRFLDTISRNPAWKDTIVVVMSDHLSMRNDAWPLYPADYMRRPLLFILNGGQGRRDMRLYHMDVAPTVLHLMGVATNAGFIAGADRSGAGAPDSPQVDDPANVAALREAVWSRSRPVALCRDGVLVGGTHAGLAVGGHEIPLLEQGRPRVGLASDQALAVFVGKRNLTTMFTSGQDLRHRVRLFRHGGQALLIEPLTGIDPMRQFKIAWVGNHGAEATLAEVPRFSGLELSTPDCRRLLARINQAPAGETLDLRGRFHVRTAPLYPTLPSSGIDFRTHAVRMWQRDYGWTPPESWGSWTRGAAARLGFTLPATACHRAMLKFKVHPFVHASRPRLDVKVLANGKLMKVWHFDESSTTWPEVETPVLTSDNQCRVDLRFEYARPGASPPPYPADEDPRPLQLDFVTMGWSPLAAPEPESAAR